MTASTATALEPVPADDLDTVDGGCVLCFIIGFGYGIGFFRPS